MSNLRDTLYRLGKRDMTAAGVALANAFQNDPLWGKIFDGESELEKKYAACLEIPTRISNTYGHVYATSEKLEGVMAYSPGSKSCYTLWNILRSGGLLSAFRIGSKAGRLMGPVFEPLDKDRTEQMLGREYIYLHLLGVQKAYQGQGHGGRLIRALFEECDAAKLPIYLDTETEKNAAMYEHLGFKTVKEITLPIINQPMWEMIREPQ